MNNIFTRPQTHFVLWCPAKATPPELIIGQIQNGNPPKFKKLARKLLQQAADAGGPIDGLWELDASTLGLTDGQTYHYWFKVDNKAPGASDR